MRFVHGSELEGSGGDPDGGVERPVRRGLPRLARAKDDGGAVDDRFTEADHLRAFKVRVQAWSYRFGRNVDDVTDF